MARARQTIEHPVTGELIRWHLTGADTDGTLARAEWRVPAGGRVGVEHVDALAEERVEVLAGSLTGRVDGAVVTLGPGESCSVPADVPRGWANAGPGELRLMLELVPAGGFEAAVDAHFRRRPR